MNQNGSLQSYSPLSKSFISSAVGSVVDFFRPSKWLGKVKTDPDPNMTPDRIQFSIRLRFNPLGDLTPERLTQYLNSFRLGFFRFAALTWDAMERRDDRLQTVAPKRKKSVARHGWEILTVDDSPEAEAQKEFLEYFYNHVETMTALEPDEQGGLSLLVRQMMDAVGKHYAVHEIVWQPQADGNLSARFIACPLWWFEGTRGKLRFLLNEFAIYGEDMNEGEWLVTVGDGLMEACSVAYMFKHLPLRDWLAYSERFGTPGILGKTEAAIDSPEWEAMEETVRNFAGDWAAVTNQTNSIDLVEAEKAGSLPFQPLVSEMNEAMTRMWRGADLGTSSKHDATGASLQADETAILEVDDAVLISETLTRKVSKFALQWKYGPDVTPLAYIKIKVAEEDITELDLKVYQFLLSCGFPISKQTASETFSIAPATDAKPEDLLKAPATPAQNSNQKMPDDDGDADIANAKITSASDRLVDNSRRSVALAIEEDLSHVLDRLNAILQIEDGALMRQKLEVFFKDFPKMEQDILRDPQTARAFQPVIGAALANGLATPLPALANEYNPDESRDSLGRWVDENGGGLSERDNIARGQKAMDRALRQKSDVKKAMYRKGVGQIDFNWGTPGQSAPDEKGVTHKGGFGISHVVAKHGEKAARSLPMALAKGKVKPHPEGDDKKLIEHDDTVVSLAKNNSRSAWVLTGFIKGR